MQDRMMWLSGIIANRWKREEIYKKFITMRGKRGEVIPKYEFDQKVYEIGLEELNRRLRGGK